MVQQRSNTMTHKTKTSVSVILLYILVSIAIVVGIVAIVLASSSNAFCQPGVDGFTFQNGSSIKPVKNKMQLKSEGGIEVSNETDTTDGIILEKKATGNLGISSGVEISGEVTAPKLSIQDFNTANLTTSKIIFQ